MAGHKATIDKDTSSYLSKTAQPESERETAYHAPKTLVGPDFSSDRNGNGDDVFNGTTTPRQGRRKADQSSAGTTGIGDTGTGLAKMESNPFASVLRSRFFSEAENPGTAGAPATSDSPSLGMYSVNNSDFRQPKADVRGMLESIALQAAETFEALDENNKIPDALASELDQCLNVITKLYEFATNEDRSPTIDNSAPVDTQPATLPVRKEEVEEESEEMFAIVAETHDGFRFMSEPLTAEETVEHVEEMEESGAYAVIETVQLSPKQKRIAPLAADLATLRAKRKMEEAVAGVFAKLISE